MFRIVRHWWSEGAGQHTARLFIFEFLVVMAGVLAAQWVQGLAQDRAAIAHMKGERARARHELERIHLTAREWLIAVPCLDRRMQEIMAGNIGSDPKMLVRPSLINPVYSPPDDDSLVLIDKVYGHRETSVLRGMAVNAANLRNVTVKIIESWGRLALLDPANGLVSTSDRAASRVAAADIRSQLHSAAIISNDFATRLDAIGVGLSDDEQRGFGPAHSCAAIWKSGRMDPPLTTR